MSGQAPSDPGRLQSLDALRGFDMLWIVGGAEVLAALALDPGGRFFGALEGQTHHAAWHGFTGWDLIFPLFLFLAGVSLPFSFAKRRAAGAGTGELVRHALRRGLTLVLLGAVYNGLLAFDYESQRYASVLGRIGLAWMFGALIAIWAGPRAIGAWIAALLLAYWAALAWIPVPGQGAASFEPGATLTDWIDRQLLPGRLHRGVRDPEGILSTVPAVATALAGVLAGYWLRGAARPGRKALVLALAGVASLGLGVLWDPLFPVNKNLWSSSFVAVTAGASLLLLALFYWVIDVRGWRSWSAPLRVFGANAITIYLLYRFVDFRGVTDLLFEGGSPTRLHPVLLAVAPLVLEWALLRWMYRRRIFLRV